MSINGYPIIDAHAHIMPVRMIKPAPLALGALVNAPGAYNLIEVSIKGVQPPLGVRDRSMPPRVIADDDMKALAAFVRARFSKKPAWTDIDKALSEYRQAHK